MHCKRNPSQGRALADTDSGRLAGLPVPTAAIAWHIAGAQKKLHKCIYAGGFMKENSRLSSKEIFISKVQSVNEIKRECLQFEAEAPSHSSHNT